MNLSIPGRSARWQLERRADQQRLAAIGKEARNLLRELLLRRGELTFQLTRKKRSQPRRLSREGAGWRGTERKEWSEARVQDERRPCGRTAGRNERESLLRDTIGRSRRPVAMNPRARPNMDNVRVIPLVDPQLRRQGAQGRIVVRVVEREFVVVAPQINGEGQAEAAKRCRPEEPAPPGGCPLLCTTVQDALLLRIELSRLYAWTEHVVPGAPVLQAPSIRCTR